MPFVAMFPINLYHLFCSQDENMTEFHSHIRRYNKAFAFTSMGGPSVDKY